MIKSKKRLGRGLDSLISSTRMMDSGDEGASQARDRLYSVGITEVTVNRIADLPIDKIQRNPHQPRQQWDEGKLSELAESIKSNGLIQPILVRAMGSGFQLIAGERRLRASQMAGLETISAIVREANEEEMLEWSLVENIHRADLNAVERARAYQQYMSRFSLTQEQVSARLGEDRSTIANYVRLLELSSELQEMVIDGSISMGHAKALLGVASKTERKTLALLAVEKNWSVRQLERVLAGQKKTNAESPHESESQDAHIRELEQELTRSIGTKVNIHPSKRKPHHGKIVIEYYTLDDYDRIRERLIDKKV
ncbi:MAG: ParB/RepB/Spo0J family partition protein [Planctomycetes bacterium]|nr:ParB/RepB/Spo0J family partition protein [Planctomycetota bacterium]